MPETSSEGTGGRSQGTQEATSKAKTSESGVKNNIFVRPVAVAGIFKPTAENCGQSDSSQVASSSGRRRSSAFTTEPRLPSGSSTLLSSEEFARRRQSWDTRLTSPNKLFISRRDSKNVSSIDTASVIKGQEQIVSSNDTDVLTKSVNNNIGEKDSNHSFTDNSHVAVKNDYVNSTFIEEDHIVSSKNSSVFSYTSDRSRFKQKSEVQKLSVNSSNSSHSLKNEIQGSLQVKGQKESSTQIRNLNTLNDCKKEISNSNRKCENANESQKTVRSNSSEKKGQIKSENSILGTKVLQSQKAVAPSNLSPAVITTGKKESSSVSVVNSDKLDLSSNTDKIQSEFKKNEVDNNASTAAENVKKKVYGLQKKNIKSDFKQSTSDNVPFEKKISENKIVENKSLKTCTEVEQKKSDKCNEIIGTPIPKNILSPVGSEKKNLNFLSRENKNLNSSTQLQVKTSDNSSKVIETCKQNSLNNTCFENKLTENRSIENKNVKPSSEILTKKTDSSSKVYGLSKRTVAPDTVCDESKNKTATPKTSLSASSGGFVEQKTEDAASNISNTKVEICNELKKEENFSDKSGDDFKPELPPKSALVKRRTSGAIAARIQDIFSNFTSDNKPSTKEKNFILSKKSSEEGKKVTSTIKPVSHSVSVSQGPTVDSKVNNYVETVISESLEKDFQKISDSTVKVSPSAELKVEKTNISILGDSRPENILQSKEKSTLQCISETVKSVSSAKEISAEVKCSISEIPENKTTSYTVDKAPLSSLNDNTDKVSCLKTEQPKMKDTNSSSNSQSEISGEVISSSSVPSSTSPVSVTVIKKSDAKPNQTLSVDQKSYHSNVFINQNSSSSSSSGKMPSAPVPHNTITSKAEASEISVEKITSVLPMENSSKDVNANETKTETNVSAGFRASGAVSGSNYYSSYRDFVSSEDISEYSKTFINNSEIPRPPERKRFTSSNRSPLPPLVPLRSTVTRTSSLKRSDDSTSMLSKSLAVLRSPSHNSLPSYSPHRYSYTEMLSKLCSYGLPVTPDLEQNRKFKSRSTILSSSSSPQVSELWSDLTEEQSTSAHTSEMLEAETAERMRLEKEVQQLQSRYSHAQQKSDKMEMEMMEARVYRTTEVNGELSEEEDSEANGSLYKQKYEKAVRDMEMMKRRIQQQHEEEMEQKLMLKKAADKKLADALEDVEEERQVASQWKRKAQKLSSELQDLRLMLEEQMARNGELEKKQRRFDAELSACQEEIRKEKLLREKLSRERDQALHEKYSLEQELQSTRLDMDMQHEKITQLNREIDELTLSSKGEEEVTQLKRVKQELERKMRDQEEELEELAGQVQMLEQAKLRLEMSLEKLRQEHRRETSVREEEIEEIRASSSKKIKNLEAQLELEQEERHQLVKQKHELERRIIELTDQPPAHDPEIEKRLRRDLKRTKALLRDAQSMLEHVRDGQGNKSLIRQLKNQLEDAEFAKSAALKAKQTAEMELQDIQSQLEEATRMKNDAESRCLQLSREKSAFQTQLEEMEEEMAEVMKKYKSAVAQMSADQKTISEQNQQITELEAEKLMLKDQLAEVNTKFEHLTYQSDDAHRVHLLDSKVRDLESKLELEQTTRSRLEHQMSRLKEQNERIQEECDNLRNKELQSQEGARRLQRQIRELRDDYAALQQKEADANRKAHELETALENTEADLQVTKNDLRLACQRIQDLQNALEDDLDSGTDVPDDSGSDSDSSIDVSSQLRHSLALIQRHDSISSNLSMCSDGRRSITPSFITDGSVVGSRNDVEADVNGFSDLDARYPQMLIGDCEPTDSV